MKEAGIIECYWKRGENITLYVFTKSLEIPKFEKHIKVCFGEDRYTSNGTPKGRVPEEKIWDMSAATPTVER